ncbi:right-handed parallel beta-helix repeat-containing protein [Herbiconiux sp. A18JL235]|uniref:Right-handed parallel beta-helix repeat-containing protein n=1 Tax=Herbiconiux sp. A18JL235 TaxID=3152363 RepID=A0AB39BJT4_9MICO
MNSAFSRRIFLSASVLGAATIAVEAVAPPMRVSAATLSTLPELSGTSADATAALARYLAGAGSNATIVGDYFIDAELPLPHSVTSLQIPSGSRLKVRGNHAGLTRAGTVTFRELLASNVAQDATGVVAASPGAYKVGEYILVTTYDVVPKSPDKYGYLRRVSAVSGSQVALDKAIPRPMTLQPRTAAVSLAPSVRIWGAGEILSTDPLVSRSPLIAFFAVDNPVVEGVSLHDSGGTGVNVAHSLNGAIDCTISDLRDDGTDYFGYGVNVTGATRGLTVKGTISRVRHAVTTNAGPQVTGIGPAGEPEDCRFEPVVSNCSDKSIDTHRVGWNTTIVPNIVGGKGGVQIRADNTRVIGGTINASSGPGIAISDVVGVAATVSGVSISNLKASGTALLCKAPVNATDVKIRDCYGTNIVLANNSTVTGGSISAGGNVGVQFLGSNNTVRGIQLGASVTTPYIEASGATNNVFEPSPPTDIEALPAPKAVTAPGISGTPSVGSQLRASTGSWDVAGVVFTYTWLRNGVEITGAIARTHPKYDIISVDMGKTLTVKVMADRVGYAQGVSLSEAVPVAQGPALQATTAPVMSGTGEIGTWLSVTKGTWTPAAQSWSYAWLVEGVEQAGLTADRVQIRSSWAGKSVAVRVTATRTGWASGSVTTSAKRMAGAAITNTAKPVISGTPKVGSFITVSNGSWNPYPSGWAVTWLVNGAVVSGLTTSRVQVRSDWSGKQVSAKVTASKPGWTASTAESAKITIEAAPLVNKTRPSLSGTGKVGSFLTVAYGSWSPSATSHTVAWYVNGALVSGLTTTRVQVMSAWKAKSIVAKVTAKRAGFTSASSSTQPLIAS